MPGACLGWLLAACLVRACFAHECSIAADCANLALNNLSKWMFGFEKGPGGEISGAAYRNATVPLGRQLAERAAKLDPALSTAAVAMSTSRLLDWSWDDAVSEAHRAVSLNSSDAASYQWLSHVQTALLDLDGALESAKHAEALEPDDIGNQIATGGVFYMRRDFADLRDKMLPLVRKYPDNVAAWDWLAMAYKGLCDYDASIQAYQTALNLAPNDEKYPLTELLASLGHTFGVAGRLDEARHLLEQLQDISLHKYVDPLRLAFVETGLGNVSSALQYLWSAVDLKLWELAFVRSEPWFDPLRNQSQFAEIVHAIGFPSTPLRVITV